MQNDSNYWQILISIPLPGNLFGTALESHTYTKIEILKKWNASFIYCNINMDYWLMNWYLFAHYWYISKMTN